MPRRKQSGTSVFAQRLTQLRRDHQLTQAELAGQLGMGRGVIGYYESVSKNPRIDTIRRFADFFGVSISELVEEPTISKRSGPTSRVDQLAEQIKQMSPHKQRYICGVIERLVESEGASTS